MKRASRRIPEGVLAFRDRVAWGFWVQAIGFIDLGFRASGLAGVFLNDRNHERNSQGKLSIRKLADPHAHPKSEAFSPKAPNPKAQKPKIINPQPRTLSSLQLNWSLT